MTSRLRNEPPGSGRCDEADRYVRTAKQPSAEDSLSFMLIWLVTMPRAMTMPRAISQLAWLDEAKEFQTKHLIQKAMPKALQTRLSRIVQARN